MPSTHVSSRGLQERLKGLLSISIISLLASEEDARERTATAFSHVQNLEMPPNGFIWVSKLEDGDQSWHVDKDQSRSIGGRGRGGQMALTMKTETIQAPLIMEGPNTILGPQPGSTVAGSRASTCAIARSRTGFNALGLPYWNS